MTLIFVMLNSTKIKRKIEINNFIQLTQNYSKTQIECTPHTFFRLSQKQREIFTCDELKRILIHEKPFLTGIQKNQNYAAFYEYKDKILKMILRINDRKINIVTFYFIEQWQIPRI